jgi:hypothetical protein
MEEGRGKIEETVIKQEVLLSMLHALCALPPIALPFFILKCS